MRHPLLVLTASTFIALTQFACSSEFDLRSGDETDGSGAAAATASASASAASDASDSETATVQAMIHDASLADPAPASGEAGRLVGNFIVSLRSQDGFWVDVGRHTSMTIPLRDPAGGSAIEAMDEVPPGTYTEVRVLLCHSSVDLEPGVRVGAETLADARNVHITETGDVVVQRDIPPLTLGAGSRSELHIDLNSGAWLNEEAVRSGEASIPAFEREVAVAVGSTGPR